MTTKFNGVIVLSAAILINMSAFSQEGSNYLNSKSQKEKTMATEQVQHKNKATVRKLFENILNTGKFELLDEIISEEYVGFQGEKGAKGLAQGVSSLRGGFPDIKWTIEDLIAEDNKVMARWIWKGTHTGSFNGFAATNKEVIHNAIVIYQFSEGKIIKAWMQADRLAFYQQIGVISAELSSPPVRN